MTAVNLRRLSIDMISWTSTSEMDDPARQRLGLGRKPSSRKVARDGYEWEGDTRNHFILEMRPHGAEVEIELLTHPLPLRERLTLGARRRVDRMVSVYELLDEIGGSTEANLRTHVHWTFPPGTRKPIVSLPLLSISASGVPSSEVVGVRMVQGNTSVILDLDSNRSLHVAMNFPYATKVSRDIIKRIVAHATTILTGFLIPEESSNGHYSGASS